MLRMGRGFKNDAPDKEQSHEAAQQPAPQPSPDTQPAHSPSHASTPAPRNESHPAHDSVGTASASRAVTESESLARDIKDGIMSGFVGSATALSGDAEFKGMLRVDGRFTGRISSEKGVLIVSAGGVVEANVQVATAKINGTVKGDIIATERIEFGRTAQVSGNIQTPSLVMENGAIFEGGCRMRRNQETKPLPEKPREADMMSRKKVEKDERVPFNEKAPAPALAEAVK